MRTVPVRTNGQDWNPVAAMLVGGGDTKETVERCPLQLPLTLSLFAPSGQVVLLHLTPVRTAPVRTA